MRSASQRGLDCAECAGGRGFWPCLGFVIATGRDVAECRARLDEAERAVQITVP